MEGSTSFEEQLRDLVARDCRYLVAQGYDFEQFIRDTMAAHQAELDRRVLEARVDELKILRFESEVTVLGAQYISGRIAEIEAREEAISDSNRP